MIIFIGFPFAYESASLGERAYVWRTIIKTKGIQRIRITAKQSVQNKRIFSPLALCQCVFVCLFVCVCVYALFLFSFAFCVICSFRWLLGCIQRDGACYMKFCATITTHSSTATVIHMLRKYGNNLLNACQKLVFTCVWSRFVPSRRITDAFL